MNEHLGAAVAAGIRLKKSEWLSRIEKIFWPEGSRRDVWMIADAARDREVRSTIRTGHLEHYCLYSGQLPPALEAAAPYLVQLDYDDRDTQSLIERAWGRSWGVFLRCDKDADSLRHHLRRFLLVHDPGGNRLVFRYYDPRVLRVYLPTCTSDELRTVYGPIERFWVEDAEAGAVLEFRFSLNRLVAGKVSLDGS